MLAWLAYADDNDGRIVRGDVREHDGDHPDGIPWVEKDWPRDGSLSDAQLIQAVKDGALFPYTMSIRLYKCPNGLFGEWRTYAAVDAMNADDLDGGKMLKHRTEIRSPAYRSVFVDDSGATPMGAWSIHYGQPAWWDEPPNRHGDGGTWGFADGHSEYWKWQDLLTYTYNATNEPEWKHVNFPNSLDIPKTQRAAWGELGY